MIYSSQGVLRRLSIAMLLIAALAFVVGCGGGGSGPAAPTSFGVGGRLSDSSTRVAALTRVLPAGITVNGYVWPDLTNVVATTTTSADGRYRLVYPPSAIGKTAVEVALYTVGGVTKRFSTISPALAGTDVVDADVNPSTSIATEMVLKVASGPPVITNISGSAFATVVSEVRASPGVDSTDLSVGGANFQATLGSGLKAAGPAATRLASNATITAELQPAQLADSGNTSVASARQAVQMVRTLVFTVVNNQHDEQTGLSAAINAQQTTITNGVSGSAAFTARMGLIGDLLGISSNNGGGGNGGPTDPGPKLEGNPQGTYIEITDINSPDGKTIVRTGNSPDGKSWKVTSQLPGATNGQVCTITPDNAIPVFRADLSAGGFTFAVRNSADSALQYDGRLTVTLTAGTVSALGLTITLRDAALTLPITFNGSISATPATGATTTGPYTGGSFTGTLTSQYGTATIAKLAPQWYTNSSVGDVKKVTLDAITIADTFTPGASLSVTNVDVEFDTPQVSDNHRPILKSIAFAADFKVGAYELALANTTLGFARLPGVTPPQSRVATITGATTYTSPKLNIQGSINGTWNNPNNSSDTLAGFPLGSLRIIGDITPTATMVPYGADVTLTGTTSGASGIATLTVGRLSLGSQNITGSVVKTTPSTGGVLNGSAATYSVALVQQPTGVHIDLAGNKTGLAGTISSGSTGSAKIADVGKANTLGLPDLGNAVIIKYVDGTFESASSILP